VKREEYIPKREEAQKCVARRFTQRGIRYETSTSTFHGCNFQDNTVLRNRITHKVKFMMTIRFSPATLSPKVNLMHNGDEGSFFSW
jgi:hypothetical protein